MQKNCYKDCPDFCSFNLQNIANDSPFQFFAWPHHSTGAKNLCAKLPRFFSREANPQVQSFYHNEPLGHEKMAAKLVELLQEKLSAKILYMRGSGSIGLSMKSWDYLMNTFPQAYFVAGSSCDAAGEAAHVADFEVVENPPLSQLKTAKTIFLFGKDAVTTSPHLMQYLTQFKKGGTELIYIDPIANETSRLCDFYFQIHPGSDGCLAYLIGSKQKLWPMEHEETELLRMIGLSPTQFASLSAHFHIGQTAIIAGSGLQRYINGKNSMQWINRLAWHSQNIDRYFWTRMSKAQYDIPPIQPLQTIPIGDLTSYLKNQFFDLIWIVAANPVISMPESNVWQRALQQTTSVVIDTNWTASAKAANYFMKVAGMFFTEDKGGSYFFPNQSADKDLSDELKLMKKQNQWFTDFELVQFLAQKLGTDLQIPLKAITLGKLKNESRERKMILPKISLQMPSNHNGFRLLTLSHKKWINSQVTEDLFVRQIFINRKSLALCQDEMDNDSNKKFSDNNTHELVKVISLQSDPANDFFIAELVLSDTIPNGIALVYKGTELIQGWANKTITSIKTTDANGLAYYDTWVQIKKIENGENLEMAGVEPAS